MKVLSIIFVCLALTSSMNALVNGGNAPTTGVQANCLETGKKEGYQYVCNKCAPGFRLLPLTGYAGKLIVCIQCPKYCAVCLDLNPECPQCANGYVSEQRFGKKVCIKTEETPASNEWSIRSK